MISDAKYTTGQPPCALVYIEEKVVVGTYQLHEKTGARTGSLDILSPNLLELVSKPVESAILDIRNNGKTLYTAHADGKIQSWTLENSEVNKTDEITIDSDALVLQISLHSANPWLVASMSNGEVVVVDLETKEKISSFEPHGAEAWTCIFDQFCDTGVFSGGDDMCMRYHDLRQPETVYNLKHHQAGVTSLLCCEPETLWTGGYDDELRIVDPRMRKARRGLTLSGGVWRLLPKPQESNCVLACCMYGGACLVRDMVHPSVSHTLTNHESMVYGGAWAQGSQGYTCSFYDCLVQKWHV